MMMSGRGVRGHSLRGFLEYFFRRFGFVFRGQGVLDAVRIFFAALFASVPNLFVEKAGFLEHVRGLGDRIVSGARVRVGECVFHAVDVESLFIVSDDFERWMWDLVCLGDGGVFVDVGAHVGKYAVQVAKRFPHAKVVAVEACPRTFSVLAKNVRVNGLDNVVLYNVAAWNGFGEVRLKVGRSMGHNSVVFDVGERFYAVPAVPLDFLLEDVGRIDFVKVDVEGAELMVLEGMRESIGRWRPKVVVEVKDDPGKLWKCFPPGYGMVNVAPEYYMFYPLGEC
ncbi:MAG: FkbM family methyltransferase [Nitrososphaeria archaeon]